MFPGHGYTGRSSLRGSFSIPPQEHAPVHQETVLGQRRADAGEQHMIEEEIVGGEEAGGQDLVRLVEVADVGGGVVAAGRAVAVRVDRTEILRIASALDVDAAAAGVGASIAAQAGGQ